MASSAQIEESNLHRWAHRPCHDPPATHVPAQVRALTVAGPTRRPPHRPSHPTSTPCATDLAWLRRFPPLWNLSPSRPTPSPHLPKQPCRSQLPALCSAPSCAGSHSALCELGATVRNCTSRQVYPAAGNASFVSPSLQSPAIPLGHSRRLRSSSVCFSLVARLGARGVVGRRPSRFEECGCVDRWRSWWCWWRERMDPNNPFNPQNPNTPFNQRNKQIQENFSGDEVRRFACWWDDFALRGFLWVFCGFCLRSLVVGILDAFFFDFLFWLGLLVWGCAYVLFISWSVCW